MVTAESLEGTIDDQWWYHLDVRNDVLYVTLLAERETPSVSEETPEGTFRVLRESDDVLIGYTLISWWKRFGTGAAPESLTQIKDSIERWVRLDRAA